MTITHRTDIRNTATDAVVDAIDVGALNANGKIQLWSADLTVKIAEIDCQNPAFGNASGGSATLNDTAVVTTDNAGTIGILRFVDRDGNQVMDLEVGVPGTAGCGGADIEMTATTFGAGDTIGIQNLAYEAIQ